MLPIWHTHWFTHTPYIYETYNLKANVIAHEHITRIGEHIARTITLMYNPLLALPPVSVTDDAYWKIEPNNYKNMWLAKHSR